MNNLKELIRKNFFVCIQGFRYTFSFFFDRSTRENQYYVKGVLNIGYLNPNNNKRKNRKPYSVILVNQVFQ